MPGIPLSFLAIGAFMGTDESIPSLQLADVFASSGNENSYLDKLGRIRTIGGFVRNTTVIPLSQDGRPMRGRGLYQYGKRTGDAVTRQLLCVFDDDVARWEIHLSTDSGSTFTFKSSRATVGAIPDFAQMGDTLVITDSSMSSAAFSWDGTTLAAISNTQLAAPTIADGGAGQLNGNYLWKVLPVKTTGVRKYASVSSALTTFTNRKATVTWLADPDGTVGSYEVYRTVAGGAVFYLLGTVPVGTLTFTDNVHDLELIAGAALAQHGDAPVSGFAYCEPHAQRMWYGVLSSAPRTWYYSDPGLPTSVWSQNFIDCTDAESFTDIGRGAIGNFRKMMVLFLERSIWTISGTGTFNGPVIDFTRFRSDAITGTVSHRSVVRVPGGARWRNANGEMQVTGDVMLAYLTPRADIRIFDGQNDTIISFPMADTFKRLNYAQRTKSYAVTDKTRSEITWVFPADSSNECSLAVSWNYRFGTWDKRPIWNFNHAVEVDGATSANIMLSISSLTSPGAVVYTLWSGNSADGQPFRSRVLTKTLYGVSQNINQPSTMGSPLMSHDKRWRWIDLLMDIVATSNVTCEWMPGEAADDDPAYGMMLLSSPPLEVASKEGYIIKTSDNVIVSAPQETLRPFRVQLNQGGTSHFTDFHYNPRYLHARGIRLRISSISSVGGFFMVGANVAYQVLTGLKRSFVR